MKKSILILLGMFIFSLGVVSAIDSCTDSDKGDYPYLDGVVISMSGSNSETFSDECSSLKESDFTKLIEYSCSGDTLITTYYYCDSCGSLKSCESNIDTLSEYNDVIDSDNGNYPLLPGKINYILTIISSKNGDTIVEYDLSNYDQCDGSELSEWSETETSLGYDFVDCTDYGLEYSCVETNYGDYCGVACIYEDDCDRGYHCVSGYCLSSSFLAKSLKNFSKTKFGAAEYDSSSYLPWILGGVGVLLIGGILYWHFKPVKKSKKK